MVSRIYQVNSVDLGWSETEDDNTPALTIAAQGLVNSGGWSNPELGPWSYIRQPEDGVLDIDFFAFPPTPGTMVTAALTPVKAQMIFKVPVWVTTIRVHSSTNSIMAELPPPSATRSADGGSSVPWPWPWYQELEIK
jgi:hypothetical protein